MIQECPLCAMEIPHGLGTRMDGQTQSFIKDELKNLVNMVLVHVDAGHPREDIARLLYDAFASE